MKKYVGIYLISVLISGVVSILPWLLIKIGIIGLRYDYSSALVGAIIAIPLSFLYIVKKTDSLKTRIVMFLLNPSLYYLIVLLLILFALYREDWNGWDRLIP